MAVSVVPPGVSLGVMGHRALAREVTAVPAVPMVVLPGRVRGRTAVAVTAGVKPTGPEAAGAEMTGPG